MPLDEHSPVRQRVLRALEGFVDAFGERDAPAHLQSVLNDDRYLKGEKLGQKPERFVEDRLIWDVLGALGYEFLPQPYGYPRWDGTTPDFAVTNLGFDFEFSTLGEVKTPNKFGYAEENVVDYVHSDLGKHTVAFATDGVRWAAYFRNERDEDVHRVAEANLIDALKPLVKRHVENEGYETHDLRGRLCGIGSLAKPELEETVTEGVREGRWE